MRRPGPIPLRAAVLGAALCWAGATPALGGSFRVESHVTPRAVGLDGLVLLTIEVEGPGYEQPRLRPRFELENLEIVGGADQTHGITVGTGGSGWRYSWTWRLRPLAVGHAAVVDIHLLVGEREVDLAPQRLEVLATSPPGATAADPRSRRSAPRSRFEELLSPGLSRWRRDPGEGAGEEPALFLRAVASPARPYVGERVAYTLYLYTRVPVRAMEPERLPAFQGLWARPVELAPSAQERVEWEGELYNRVALLRRDLFALRAETHVVEPVRIRFVVDRIERDRLFFSPVRVPVEVVRESNPVPIEVRALPPAGPAGTPDFGGAVGELSLRAALEPTELAVDQGATLTVTAAGDGHLEAMAAPRLTAPAGLEVSDPEWAPPPDGGQSASARRWRYLVVPRRPGVWRLPAIEVPYFDPGAGEYRLARAALPELVAHGPAPGEGGDEAGPEGAAGAAPAAAADAPSRAARSAAAPPPGGGSRIGSWRDALPWGLALAPLAALVVILVRHRGRRSVAGGRPAGRAGQGDFHRRLEAALRQERPRRAAAAIERAWRDLLAETRALPEAVPPASWPDELLRRGVAGELCRELRELLADLHYLRYAPELSTTSALAGELVARSERLARSLGA